MKPIRDWFRHTFSDPQVLLLTVLLVIAVIAIVFVAHMVAPVIAALVIAFLLDSLVERLKLRGVRHIVAVIGVYIAFVVAALVFLGGLLPLLTRQTIEFAHQIPQMIATLRDELLTLPERYPDFVTADPFSRSDPCIVPARTLLAQLP